MHMDMEFDSKEELYFSWYLEVLRNWNFIEWWNKNEKSYQLTHDVAITHIKEMKRVPDKVLTQILLPGRVYTPDFLIKWTDQAEGIFTQELKDGKKIKTPFISQGGFSMVETKGNADYKNMTRLAICNIKDTYHKHKIFVSLIKVPLVFKQTFTPERYLLTDKSLKPRTIKYATRTIKDFINSIQE